MDTSKIKSGLGRMIGVVKRARAIGTGIIETRTLTL